jgi:hypothetical protein
LVVMVLVRFDVTPVGGEWKEPEKRKADMWNAMPKPDCDVDVVLRPRGEGEREGEWKFVWE